MQIASKRTSDVIPYVDSIGRGHLMPAPELHLGMARARSPRPLAVAGEGELTTRATSRPAEPALLSSWSRRTK